MPTWVCILPAKDRCVLHPHAKHAGNASNFFTSTITWIISPPEVRYVSYSYAKQAENAFNFNMNCFT